MQELDNSAHIDVLWFFNPQELADYGLCVPTCTCTQEADILDSNNPAVQRYLKQVSDMPQHQTTL